MKKFFAQYIADKNGTTAIEYSLIAVGIAMAIIVAVTLLGDELRLSYENIASVL